MTISKNAKKLFAFALSVLFVVTLFSGIKTEAFASSGISVTYNSSAVVFDQAPIIKNGRTLVPLRAIFEAMGLSLISIHSVMV